MIMRGEDPKTWIPFFGAAMTGGIRGPPANVNI